MKQRERVGVGGVLMVEIFKDNSNSKKIRSFLSSHYPENLEFYDDLDYKYKRKYHKYISRSNKPLSPNMWYVQQEYNKYEYSFGEIASILNLTKQEVISSYISAMKKLKFLMK